MKKLNDYNFKYNKTKQEFLNLDQTRKNLNEIYSIRLGTHNTHLYFINMKTKEAIKNTFKVIDEKIITIEFNNELFQIERSKLKENTIIKFQSCK